MREGEHVGVAVVGAGIAGVATTYYLCVEHGCRSVLLIDGRQPLCFTSAQSGDNYRNWWPHPTMVSFTNDSIERMEQIARNTSNVFNMTRRGYALATRRRDIDDLIAGLSAGYGDENSIRTHSRLSGASYVQADSPDWAAAPDGVDILADAALIRKSFPSYDMSIANVIHIRRAGDISSQQLGQFMLGQIRNAGGRRIVGDVQGIERNRRYNLTIGSAEGPMTVTADTVVNAAGPFARRVAAMLGVDLPIENVFQQKLAVEDAGSLVPRQLPFSVDLDPQELEWTDEEREWLAGEPDLAWLTRKIAGGTHCRPDGGTRGTWIKLGWACNRAVSEPQQDLASEPLLDPHFPEIVMRGAVTLQPALRPYSEALPARRMHYGGYYPMTRENWPLIGPLDGGGAFVVGALSGFGSMAACAAGDLCARHVLGKPLPAYASQLTLARYDDAGLMTELSRLSGRGIL